MEVSTNSYTQKHQQNQHGDPKLAGSDHHHTAIRAAHTDYVVQNNTESCVDQGNKAQPIKSILKKYARYPSSRSSRHSRPYTSTTQDDRQQRQNDKNGTNLIPAGHTTKAKVKDLDQKTKTELE